MNISNLFYWRRYVEQRGTEGNFEKVLPGKTILKDFPLNIIVPHLGEKQVQPNAREIMQIDGNSRKIFVAFEDVTDSNKDGKFPGIVESIEKISGDSG